MYANYHTHTTRCQHATGEDRAYVESAIRAGIKVLGFADHAPYDYGDDYRSWMRMSPSEAEDYVRSLRRLAEEYRDDIEIRVGFEAEYFPALFPQLLSRCRELGVEYFILGHHCLHDERTGRWVSGRNGVAAYTEYVDEVLEGLATGYFSCFCHPDMFYMPEGDLTPYRKEAKRLLSAVKAMGIPVEYNLLGLRSGRHYPLPAFFDLVAEVGNDVILGRDAHAPEMLEEAEVEARARALLSARGITPLETLPLRSLTH